MNEYHFVFVKKKTKKVGTIFMGNIGGSKNLRNILERLKSNVGIFKTTFCLFNLLF